MDKTRERYLLLKQFVYGLDHGVCHICHKRVAYDKAVLDHIIPKAVIGRPQSECSDEYWNLRIAHKRCNTQRGAALVPGQIRLNIPEGRSGR